MEKRFTKVNGRSTDLGEGFGVIGWHDFLAKCEITPVNFRVWKSRMKASLVLAQRKQVEAEQKLLRDADREKKVRLAVALKAQEEAAERALIDAKTKLAVMDESVDAETLAKAKDMVEAAEQVTEAVHGKVLEFTPKSRTAPSTSPKMDAEKAAKVAADDDFVVLAAELAELILGVEGVPTPEVFTHMVTLAQGIKKGIAGTEADHTPVVGDPDAVSASGTAVEGEFTYTDNPAESIAQSNEPLKAARRSKQYTEKAS